MSIAVKQRLKAVASDANQRGMTRLIKSGRVPRTAFQHYFIEAEGLHSRIHLQNFYSTFWPHLRETVTGQIVVYDSAGARLGIHSFSLPPFGSLFLEMRELLAAVGAHAPEGTVTIDLAPPEGALKELAAFPIPEPWGLRLSTPFWMAYYDQAENYMYVHSIDRHVGEFYGVPATVGRMLSRRFGTIGKSWRAGRLLDVHGLVDFQIVTINHGDVSRSATVGAFDSGAGEPLWTEQLEFPPRALHRVRVDPDVLRQRGTTSFRVGVDPLPTPNGKPYVLMRYGDGPLSLHHG